MLYSQEKERSHRFILALRMGLPLFSLTIILIFARLSEYFQKIPTSFFILAIFILAISIYYIFYMIYRGFDEQITDPITHTFTRTKLISILKKDINRYKDYSILLISVENIYDINSRYGIDAGDKILNIFAQDIGHFFEEKKFTKFPIGHFKGGDFIIGLQENYNFVRPIMEMLYIKFDDYTINNIEVRIKGSIVDKNLSSNVQSLIERLFELKENEIEDEEEILKNKDISPLEIEKNIRYAIINKSFSLMFQPIQADEKVAQVSVKLQDKNKKIIHQKIFMPVIKRLGYEKEFDEIVLEKVLYACKNIEDISFAFTISASVIRNRTFFLYLKEKIEEKKINPNRLIIILFENDVYSNMKRYDEQLQKYRSLGVRFVLDDVGALNASIEYIKRLNIDIIRFDKTFSKHIDSQKYFSLLHAYVTMSKELKIKSWIKMINTKESKEVIKNLNIDYIQGNIVSKIVNFERLKILNREENR